MASSLDSKLTSVYGRPFKTNQGPTFKIDDRNAGDSSSDFCSISLTIADEKKEYFLLEMSNPPINDEVKELVKAHDQQIVNHLDESLITLHLSTKNIPFLRKLAKAIRRVTARGQHYRNPNWKWISRRTTDAMVRLAKTLVGHSRCSRHGDSKQLQDG